MKELWLVTMLHNQWLQKILAGLFLAVTAYAETNSIQLSPQDIQKIEEQKVIAQTQYIPEKSETDVFSLIHYFATKNKVDLMLAFDLAEFESNFSSTVKNPSSTATGVYQITRDTFKDNCEGKVTSPYDNVSCAMKMIAKGEIWRWTADPHTRAFLIKKGYVQNITLASK